jgi:hypothetical protein
MSRTTTAVQRSSHAAAAAQRPPALVAPPPPRPIPSLTINCTLACVQARGMTLFILSGVQEESASLTKSPPGGNGAEVILDAATYYQQVMHVTCQDAQILMVGRLSPFCEIGLE